MSKNYVNKMIELKNITKHYQTPTGSVTALHDINLHVLPGEIFGIIGKSGAGKSTLIRCVNLLEEPTQGTVQVAGQILTKLNHHALRQARKQIGMIFQHFNLLATQTVYENIAFPLKIHQFGKKQIELAIEPLLELTGLKDKKHHFPHQLSGGQKQRVAIARALATQPQVLLCDEATSALDPGTTHSILKLLKQINQQLGLTILLITHEMEVIKAICDKVALIEKGQLIKQCPVIEFFSKPHPEPGMQFLKSYLRHELPEILQENLLPHAMEGLDPVLRIYFHGKITAKPIMAGLIKTFNLDINILQANIEHIQHEIIGVMVVSLYDSGIHISEEKLQNILSYLYQQHLTVEVIGYVKRYDIGID